MWKGLEFPKIHPSHSLSYWINQCEWCKRGLLALHKLNLSQMAKKGLGWNKASQLILYLTSTKFHSWILDVGLICIPGLLRISSPMNPEFLSAAKFHFPQVSQWKIDIISQIKAVWNHTNLRSATNIARIFLCTDVEVVLASELSL